MVRRARSVPSSVACLGLAITMYVSLGLTFAGSAVSPEYSDWSAPVNLGPTINSAFNDLAAAISKDGMSLYFTSNRPGGFGGEDIWVSRRARGSGVWSAPVNLGPIINTASNERAPAFSRDGHQMFFVSDRSGGVGGDDLYVSWRNHIRNDFGWRPATNLGVTVNSPSTDAAPDFFENDDQGLPQLMFTSNRPGGFGGPDIYRSDMTAEGTWGAPVNVAEINSAANDARTTTRHDGRELFFFSGRPGGLGVDLWTSTRETTLDPWSTPVNLGATVNSVFAETVPNLSSDAEALFFASNRPGFGGTDLYVTTRTKQHGP